MTRAGATIRVSIDLQPNRASVWAELERLEDHVQWMRDATAIRFTGDQRRGQGTTFDCDTRIGPLRLTDTMEIIEWDERRSMGVRHVGAVTGTGRFSLTDRQGDGTTLAWQETLVFPWWLGSGIGALLARPVLRAVWRSNLKQFARRLP